MQLHAMLQLQPRLSFRYCKMVTAHQGFLKVICDYILLLPMPLVLQGPVTKSTSASILS